METIVKKVNFLSALIFGISLLVFSHFSFAKNLNQADIQNFINTMQAINSTDNTAIKAIKDKNTINTRTNLPIDDEGNLSIYRQAILQDIEPESKNALEELVKDNGFDSLLDWATISDKVMAAYFNFKLGKEGGAEIPELTPEMRESMPPEMLNMIEQATKMLNSVKNTPQEDVSLVEKNYTEIESVMQ